MEKDVLQKLEVLKGFRFHFPLFVMSPNCFHKKTSFRGFSQTLLMREQLTEFTGGQTWSQY